MLIIMSKTVITDAKRFVANQKTLETTNIILSSTGNLQGLGYLPDDDDAIIIKAPHHLIIPNITNIMIPTSPSTVDESSYANNGISRYYSMIDSHITHMFMPQKSLLIDREFPYKKHDPAIIDLATQHHTPIISILSLSELLYTLQDYSSIDYPIHLILSHCNEQVLQCIKENTNHCISFGLLTDAINQDHQPSIKTLIQDEKILSCSTLSRSDQFIDDLYGILEDDYFQEGCHILFTKHIQEHFHLAPSEFKLLTKPCFSIIKPPHDGDSLSILGTVVDGAIYQK